MEQVRPSSPQLSHMSNKVPCLRIKNQVAALSDAFLLHSFLTSAIRSIVLSIKNQVAAVSDAFLLRVSRPASVGEVGPCDAGAHGQRGGRDRGECDRVWVLLQRLRL